jgi:hypothetical protein
MEDAEEKGKIRQKKLQSSGRGNGRTVPKSS